MVIGVVVTAATFVFWPDGTSERDKVESKAAYYCSVWESTPTCEKTEVSEIAEHIWQVKLLPTNECLAWDARDDEWNTANCR